MKSALHAIFICALLGLGVLYRFGWFEVQSLEDVKFGKKSTQAGYGFSAAISKEPFPQPSSTAMTEDALSWNETRQRSWLKEHDGQGNALVPKLHTAWETRCSSGHASPVVLGNQIFLLSGGENGVELAAYTLASGSEVWRKQITTLPASSKHIKGSPASSTPSPAGDALIACCVAGDEVWMIAVGSDSTERWRTRLGPTNAQWGFNSSPIYFRGLAFVNVDNESGGFVVAVNADSGKVVWRQPRPQGYEGSYSSPLLVIDNSGNAILVLSGLQSLVAFDAASGAPRWSLPAVSDVSAATPVYRNGVLVASSGYRRHHMIALKFDSAIHVEPKALWAATKPSDVPYVPTPLLTDTQLFVVQDEGLAQAFELHTGKSLWKKRLGFPVTASPTWLNDHLFICGEQGECVILEPGTGNKLFEMELGEPLFASPTLSGPNLLLRTRDALHCLRLDSTSGSK